MENTFGQLVYYAPIVLVLLTFATLIWVTISGNAKPLWLHLVPYSFAFPLFLCLAFVPNGGGYFFSFLEASIVFPVVAVFHGCAHLANRYG